MAVKVWELGDPRTENGSVVLTVLVDGCPTGQCFKYQNGLAYIKRTAKPTDQYRERLTRGVSDVNVIDMPAGRE